jgi:hypothetical protein
MTMTDLMSSMLAMQLTDDQVNSARPHSRVQPHRGDVRPRASRRLRAGLAGGLAALARWVEPAPRGVGTVDA